MHKRVGEVLFKFRSYTPIPLVIIAFLGSNPTFCKIIFGSVIALIGEIIRIWSMGYLGGSSRTRTVGGEFLVMSGPYAYTRNPLYLGNLLLSVGLLICFWAFMPYLISILLLLFFIQYYAIIRVEEEFLEKKFSEAYLSYKNRVPAFFPRLKRYRGQGPKFHLLRALKSERPTFQTVGILCLLLLLRCLFLDSKLPLL